MRELFFYHELENMYEDSLNDIYEIVNICGYSYDAGRALRLIDETIFNCAVSDWVSDEFEELRQADLTEEEIHNYIISCDQTIYCSKEDI